MTDNQPGFDPINKIIFITGASSGIGEASAKHFAKAGAKLLLCARRIDTLNELAAELQNQYGTQIYTFKLDVRHPVEVEEAWAALPEPWKKVDILLNNAGLAAGLDTIQEGSLQDWEDMIDTNVKGLLYVTRAVLPQMLERNSGHVINIGSISAHQVYPKGAVYCATKHAVKALSQGLRMDAFGTKIRITEIDPGMVETHFSAVRFKGDNERAAAVYEDVEALAADDVADAVLYCATRPPHVNISEMIVMPTAQVSVSMTAKKMK